VSWPSRNGRVFRVRRALWALVAIEGILGPHDLRRTFVTLALDQGLTPRQIAATSGPKDERMICHYDKGRESFQINKCSER
jgi:integrase